MNRTVQTGLHAEITEKIIGCAIEVHRHLGPGLLEAAYEEALCIELKNAGGQFRRQVGVPILYKGTLIGESRPDLVVDGRVVVEVKSVDVLSKVHQAQIIRYMRILEVRVGLLINFNSAVLKSGIRRLVL